MKYLVSSNVREEVEDLLKILKKSQIAKNDITVYLPIVLKNKITLIDYHVIYFKQFMKLKLLNKTIEMIQFFLMYWNMKPDFLYTGSSMLKYRVISKIFKVTHVAYFRGLMFDPSNYSGFSDKLRFGKFSYLFQSDFFNASYADQIITISEINKKFITSRNIPAEKISLISPPWLKKNDFCMKQNKKIKTLIFITQAFKEHGLNNAHKSQISFLEKLIIYAKSNNLNIIIRKHPRDFHNYNIQQVDGILLNQEPPEGFLRTINSSSMLISPLSTFAFEAIYIGHKVIFYSTEELDKIYLQSYKYLNISPIYDIDKSVNLNNMEIKHKDLFY